MSVMHSISNCKKMLNHGIDRAVYYSPKYDMIIKKEKPGGGESGKGCEAQFMYEKSFYEQLRPAERIFFPVIDFCAYKGRTVCLMHRCTCLTDLPQYQELNSALSFGGWRYWTVSELRLIFLTLGLNTRFVKYFHNVITRFGLHDLHLGNLGVYNNHLVILDAGF